jgi:hypothetical protein
VFDKVPAGRYTLTVNRTQYLAASYGQGTPGRPGRSFPVTDGQRMAVDLRMARSGVISGLVTGEDGEPVPGARVQALRYQMVNGFRRLVSGGTGMADDRGHYRIFNLQPGEYVVSATPNPGDLTQADRARADALAFETAVAEAVRRDPGGRQPAMVTVTTPRPDLDPSISGFAPTYYPSMASVGTASTVTVGPGEERGNMDIRVQPLRAGSIRGTVLIPPGVSSPVQVSIISDDPLETGSYGTRVNPDGSFLLRTVAPGQYTLQAYTVPAPTMDAGGRVTTPVPTLQPTERLWARASVLVDGQATSEVALQLQPGRTVSGIVVFETSGAVPTVGGPFSVTLTPAPSRQPLPGGSQPQGAVDADGRFTVAGVMPGLYFLRVPGVMKSAVVDGVDTLDFPLEVTGERDITNAVLTLTDRFTELSGRLLDAAGQPGVDYTIVLASDDSRYWTPGSRRILLIRPGTDGRFFTSNVPPGGYYLAALTELENGAQYDPAFLKELAGASMRITVSQGGRHVHEMRVAQ